MSFLSPELLAYLVPLVGLPLVLHLLNKGYPAHFRFPSIELIKATMARRSTVHRWRHWILMALRTLVLLLLLFAFLQPVMEHFGTHLATATGRKVLIIFDHSVSMEDKGDGATSRERAVVQASKLIDSLAPNDEVNILLMDQNPTTCFTSFSNELNDAKHFLTQIKPGLGRADVDLANSAAQRLVPETGDASEIYYISDFERKKWSNVSFLMLPAAARLFFVDVGPTHLDNHAILDARPSQAEMLAGDVVPLEVTVGNYSDIAFRDRVTVTLDKRFGGDQAVSIGAWSQEKVTIPVTVGAPGVHECEVDLPPDALDYDNHFFLTLNVQDKEEVPIVTDAPDDVKSGAYYIKTALNPFENNGGSLLPRLMPSTDIAGATLAGTQQVFLTHINKLSPDACDAIAKFVFRGGGLIYFLDGPADPDNLASIEALIGPGTMPIRLSQRIIATNVTAGAQQIARGNFQSPYLRLFQGDARQDLALLNFYDYYQAGATSAGGVLLEYGDQSPAMASLHYGLGTILLLNFSAGELSSNLSRQRIFPAWIQNMVKTISTHEPPPSAYQIGDIVHADIWRNEMQYDMITPTGGAAITQRDIEGQRCTVSFTADQPGFYTLGAPPELHAFGVDTPTDQSDLRPIDKSVLPNQFSDNHEAHVVAGGKDYDELAKGRPVFHWFVLGALLLLLIESGFQLSIRKAAT